VIIISFVLGCATMYIVIQNGQTINDGVRLSGGDLNMIRDMTYFGGFCERLGLVGSVYIQLDNNSGKYYGLPICIAPEDSNVI